MTPNDIKAIITRIEDSYDRLMTDRQKQGWTRSLAKREATPINAALDAWIDAGEQWPPAPVDLIRLSVPKYTPVSTTVAIAERLVDKSPQEAARIVDTAIANYHRKRPGALTLYPGTGLRKFLRKT